MQVRWVFLTCVWPQAPDQALQHHLGTGWKCSFWGLTPDLQNPAPRGTRSFAGCRADFSIGREFEGGGKEVSIIQKNFNRKQGKC